MKKLSNTLKNSAKKYVGMEDVEKQKLLRNLYQTNNLSWSEIAKLCGTYTNKVRRDANKFGIKSRTKSEAQSLAIKTGRHEHPTKDKGHSDETKIKISDSVADDWKNISKEKKSIRKAEAKRRWEEKTPREIEKFRKAAGDGVRKAAKEGSALEKFLQKELTKAGYRVEFHKKHWVLRESLEIDIFLPEHNIAIEVDGPSHFRNIWGSENLAKNKQRDVEKNGLLLDRGCVVIRVLQKRALSKKFKREILSKLLKTVEKITVKRPSKGYRCITLENNNE